MICAKNWKESKTGYQIVDNVNFHSPLFIPLGQRRFFVLALFPFIAMQCMHAYMWSYPVGMDERKDSEGRFYNPMGNLYMIV